MLSATEPNSQLRNMALLLYFVNLVLFCHLTARDLSAFWEYNVTNVHFCHSEGCCLVRCTQMPNTVHPGAQSRWETDELFTGGGLTPKLGPM
jgi:hypothetical protein